MEDAGVRASMAPSVAGSGASASMPYFARAGFRETRVDGDWESM